MTEVEAALNQMHPLESPRLDGFAACFYHNSWPTIYKEVCHAVLGSLNNDVFDVGVYIYILILMLILILHILLSSLRLRILLV